MIVAAGATDREPEENRADRRRDLGQLILALDLRDHVAPHHLARAAAAEARGDKRVVIAGLQVVAGQLEHEEPIVREIGVQRADDPVAIAPGVGPFGVELESIGVGVMSQVEPVLPPAHAVLRTGKQAVDQTLVGVRTLVGQERSDLFGRRRPAGQVESDAADQRDTACRRRMAQTQLFELAEDEPIDRVLHPARFLHRLGFHSLDRLVSPVLALLGAESLGRGEAIGGRRRVARDQRAW